MIEYKCLPGNNSTVIASTMQHHCPRCGYTSDVLSNVPTYHEHPLCQKCGLSLPDAWAKTEEDLILQFSKHRLEQNDAANINPWTEATTAFIRTPFASSAAHTVPRSYMTQVNDICNKNHRSEIIAQAWHESSVQERTTNTVGGIGHGLYLASGLETAPITSDHAIKVTPSHTVEIHHDAKDLDIPDAEDIQVPENDHHDGEPYMVMGYQGLNQLQGAQITQSSARLSQVNSHGGSGLSNEPTSGRIYTPFSDPIYNSRSWWEHTGDRSIERQYGGI